MSLANDHARFADAWLSLREPADHAARAAALTGRARRWLAVQNGTHTIVDLGSGRGSNLRYLAPRLPGPQRWRLIDHDPALLAQATRDSELLRDRDGRPVNVATDTRDLADAGLEAGLAGARLVTAAALFDLVTEAWIARLARSCAGEGAAALFVLSVDGEVALAPEDRDDARVGALVRAHQRRDKSFGAALGVDAPGVLARCFEAHGYAVHTAPSVWHIDRDRAALGCALIAGWRDAACEQAPDQRQRTLAWADRRRRALRAGELRIALSHQDLFAQPPGRRRCT